MTLKFDIKIEDDRRTMDATRAYAPASGRTLRGAYAGSDPAEVLALLADFGVVPTSAGEPAEIVAAHPRQVHPHVGARLSAEDLRVLPTDSVVSDGDDDEWTKDCYGDWNLGADAGGDDPYYQEVVSSTLVAKYGPITLVRIGPEVSPA